MKQFLLNICKSFVARIILITDIHPTIWEKVKYYTTTVLQFAPIVFVLNLVNWWFTENKQFGTFMCVALIVNMGVGVVFHLKTKSFCFKEFLWKNVEMGFVITVVYIMLEMLRYTVGQNLAGEAFKMLIQVITLLYPTSKVCKNIFIMTKGKHPPEFLMRRLYDFEKNGDLTKFFEAKISNNEKNSDSDAG